MRKIEEQMNAAINADADWKYGRNAQGYPAMEVSHGHCTKTGTNYADVYLHANHIATVHKDTGEVVPNIYTFRNWPTTTTRSRLRALGIDASIKNFAAQINGEFI